MRRTRSAEAATRMRWKTRGDGEGEDGAAGESGPTRDRRSLRDAEGKESRGDAPAAGTRAVEVEVAAQSELRVFFTQDGHIGGIGGGLRRGAGARRCDWCL